MPIYYSLQVYFHDFLATAYGKNVQTNRLKNYIDRSSPLKTLTYLRVSLACVLLHERKGLPIRFDEATLDFLDPRFRNKEVVSHPFITLVIEDTVVNDSHP